METEFKKIPIGRAEDLTGKIFGHWKVLYRTENNNQGKSMWVCECDCKQHTIKPVAAGHLKSGNSTSCGCTRIQNMVKSRDEAIRIRDKNGNIIKKKCFMCQQWLTLDHYNLDITTKDGHSRMCKQCFRDYPKRIYNDYRRGAKKRKFNFDLTYEEFINLIKQPCYYCGEQPKKYNGVDRIDSLQGYFLNNCVPCCEYCNIMKKNYSLDFWFQHMKKILSNWEGKENDLFKNTN